MTEHVPNPLYQRGVVSTNGDGLTIDQVSPLFAAHRQDAFDAETKASVAQADADRAAAAAENLQEAATKAKQDAETKAAQAAAAVEEAEALKVAEAEGLPAPEEEKKPARSRTTKKDEPSE